MPRHDADNERVRHDDDSDEQSEDEIFEDEDSYARLWGSSSASVGKRRRSTRLSPRHSSSSAGRISGGGTVRSSTPTPTKKGKKGKRGKSTTPRSKSTTPQSKSGPKKDDKKWQSQIVELRTFRVANGHCDVPSKGHGKLSNFVQSQRQYYRHYRAGKKTTLTEERIQDLESVGFQWKLGSGVHSREEIDATDEDGAVGDEDPSAKPSAAKNKAKATKGKKKKDVDGAARTSVRKSFTTADQRDHLVEIVRIRSEEGKANMTHDEMRDIITDLVGTEAAKDRKKVANHIEYLQRRGVLPKLAPSISKGEGARGVKRGPYRNYEDPVLQAELQRAVAAAERSEPVPHVRDSEGRPIPRTTVRNYINRRRKEREDALRGVVTPAKSKSKGVANSITTEGDREFLRSVVAARKSSGAEANRYEMIGVIQDLTGARDRKTAENHLDYLQRRDYLPTLPSGMKVLRSPSSSSKTGARPAPPRARITKNVSKKTATALESKSEVCLEYVWEEDPIDLAEGGRGGVVAKPQAAGSMADSLAATAATLMVGGAPPGGFDPIAAAEAGLDYGDAFSGVDVGAGIGIGVGDRAGIGLGSGVGVGAGVGVEAGVAVGAGVSARTGVGASARTESRNGTGTGTGTEAVGTTGSWSARGTAAGTDREGEGRGGGRLVVVRHTIKEIVRTLHVDPEEVAMAKALAAKAKANEVGIVTGGDRDDDDVAGGDGHSEWNNRFTRERRSGERDDKRDQRSAARKRTKGLTDVKKEEEDEQQQQETKRQRTEEGGDIINDDDFASEEEQRPSPEEQEQGQRQRERENLTAPVVEGEPIHFEDGGVNWPAGGVDGGGTEEGGGGSIDYGVFHREGPGEITESVIQNGAGQSFV